MSSDSQKSSSNQQNQSGSQKSQQGSHSQQNQSGSQKSQQGSMRGGTSEQHTKAGSQSHKNR